MNATQEPSTGHSVVSRAEWIEARKALMVKEKEVTRLYDEMCAARRALPWVRVEEDSVFQGPSGEVSLVELFAGRSQLVIYHFMYGPGWEEGCKSCSFISDNIDAVNLHLPHHDVTLMAVSRAPFEEFQDFKQRMGWKFNWVSSAGNSFNFDYGVSFTEESMAKGHTTYNYAPFDGSYPELPGISVFYKDASGDVFHTYSTYARGGDILIAAHNWLDMTPLGRNEVEIMDWVRHHDRYEVVAGKDGCCGCG
jgi:predicted dithiol-disulfide oxidoreductase (DUF899 family)